MGGWGEEGPILSRNTTNALTKGLAFLAQQMVGHAKPVLLHVIREKHFLQSILEAPRVLRVKVIAKTWTKTLRMVLLQSGLLVCGFRVAEGCLTGVS
jgi:hypothetical protein